MGSSSAKEATLGLAGHSHAGDVGAFEQFPVVTVGSAVVQFAGVLDRPPDTVLGGDENFGGSLNFGKVGPHRLDDGDDLVRVDAPHAQVAELVPRAAGIVAYLFH